MIKTIDIGNSIETDRRRVNGMFTGIFQTKEEAEVRRDAIKQFCENLD